MGQLYSLTDKIKHIHYFPAGSIHGLTFTARSYGAIVDSVIICHAWFIFHGFWDQGQVTGNWDRQLLSIALEIKKKKQ